MNDGVSGSLREAPPVFRARVTSRLAHSTLATIAALVLPCLTGTTLGGLVGLPNLVMAVCLTAWLFAWVALAWPTKVTLGVDGALLEWLGTRRWVSWSEVAEVRTPRWSFAIELVTRGGRTVTIPTRKAYGISAGDINLTQVLMQRIMHETSRAAPKGSGVERLTRPAGHTVEAWIQSLRAVGQGAAGHLRQSSVSRDSLRDTMEDTSLSESLRGAAAVALASLGARDEVRVRVESIASPRLRAVMDAAARDDEPRLVAALRELEAREQKAG